MKLRLFFILACILPLPLLADEPDANTPQIHILLSGGFSGQAVHVDAIGIPLAAGSELTAQYDWDFGDPGTPFNQLSGWNAAHLYDQPGSYPITLTITDETGGKQVLHAFAEVDEVHRTTYFFAHDGSDNNTGLDADHPMRSTARINKLIRPHTRFLFHNGDTFPVTDSITIQAQDVTFGSYTLFDHAPTATAAPVAVPSTRPLMEPDQRPRLLWVGKGNSSRIIKIMKGGTDVTLRNLVFDSDFTQNNNSLGPPGAVECGGTNIAIIHCRFLNIVTAANCELNPTGVLVQQCDAPQVTTSGLIVPADHPDYKSPDVSGLRAYFVWVQGRDIVIIGNTVANSTREHCVRIFNAHGVLVADNDLQNLDREGIDKSDIAKATVAANSGDHLYCTHNILRSGGTGVGREAGTAEQEKLHWDTAVWDGNTLYCPLIVNPGCSNIMVRNNLCYRNNWGGFLINGAQSEFSRDANSVFILHNTVIDRSAKGNFFQIEGPAEHITIANNLYIAPKLQINAGNCPLVIKQKDLSSFDSIRNNVWAVPGASGGIISLNGSLLTPDQWNQTEKVAGDRFLAVEVDRQGEPLVPIPVPPVRGAGEAMDGSPRTDKNTWAGALAPATRAAAEPP